MVLFEGWMFGFNPLDEVSLPVWTNKTALIDAAGDSSHSSELQEMEQLQSAEEEIVRRNEFELAYSKAKSIQVPVSLFSTFPCFDCLVSCDEMVGSE